jgi:DNA-binding NarL/FixJ family response regulator
VREHEGCGTPRASLAAIRLYLLGGVTLYRECLSLALERAHAVRVVGSADSWAGSLDDIAATRPDIVLLDMTTPGSLEAVAELLALWPAPRVVAMAVDDGNGDVLACAEAGISGYITTTDSLPAAVDAIESVARGELLTTPRLAAMLLQRVRTLASASLTTTSAKLTPREREIAALLADGHTNKAIALRLGIEPTTVKNHVHNILEKFQVHRRAEAAQRVRAELR